MPKMPIKNYWEIESCLYGMSIKTIQVEIRKYTGLKVDHSLGKSKTLGGMLKK